MNVASISLHSWMVLVGALQNEFREKSSPSSVSTQVASQQFVASIGYITG
jgi:hypothetical protein